MSTHPSTCVRLARELEAAGLPKLAQKALDGHFDDFKSDSPTPQHDLYHELAAARTSDNAEAVDRLLSLTMEGNFGATREEAQEWAASIVDPELQQVMGLLR